MFICGFISLFSCASFAAENDATGSAATWPNVRAIFAQHCLACHDQTEAEGDLVLETHASLLRGGETGKAVIPGDAEQSLLVRLIEHRDKPHMPPPKKADKLSDADIAMIRAWIDAGATMDASGDEPAVVLPKLDPRRAPRPAIYALAYEPKSKTLAIGRHGSVELRSAEHRGLIRRLDGLRGDIRALRFSPDGSRLITAGGEAGVKGEVRIYNIADGSLIRAFDAHDDALYAAALSPDGRTLATGGYDQIIILWNIDDAAPLRTLKGHNAAVFDLAFRPDGRVLAGASADRTVKLWHVETGERLDTLAEATQAVHALAFSPDGQRLAAAGVDNRIRLYRISPEAREGSNTLLEARFAHEGAILRLAWSPDGAALLSTADDLTAKLFSGDDVSPRFVLPKQSDWPVAAAFALDGKAAVVAALDGSLHYYNVADGQPLALPKPQLTSADRLAIQRGVETALRLTGQNLTDVTAAAAADSRFAVRVDPAEQHNPAAAIVHVTPAADAPLGPHTLTVTTAGGQSNTVTVHVDSIAQLVESEPNDSAEQAIMLPLPAAAWGRIDRPGDIDRYVFDAKAGQLIVLDAVAKPFGSNADLTLTLTDASGRVIASNNNFDADPDPLIAVSIPADGRYHAVVRDAAVGSPDGKPYRLAVGELPFITAVYPLSIPANAESSVRLIGYNVPPDATVTVKAGASGEAAVPLDAEQFRWRRGHNVMIDHLPVAVEVEPNDSPDRAAAITVPGVINGRLHRHAADAPSPDADLFRFRSSAGQRWIIETTAQRRGSPADTRLDVLHADGRPVDRVILRAVRDSAITFRPVDARAGGARLVNYEEMQLNQYLYMNGEVVRLFLAPRGPDSEYNFYTHAGARRTYFDTTATAHALDEPCYIVEPLDPRAGSLPPPNGLPLFTLYYANDDDSLRQLGSDSRLTFTAPAEGEYLVRVTDARGFSGDRFAYRLVIRHAAEDFTVSLGGANPAVPAGAGVRFTVNANRIDGYDGPIRVDIANPPPGFTVTTPLVIEAGHVEAVGAIFAASDAPKPTEQNQAATTVTATAVINGQTVTKTVNNLGAIKLADPPKLTVQLLPYGDDDKPLITGDTPAITVIPGQLVPAHLAITRNGHNERVTFDVDNLPHGVIVADIGLNGVLIPEDQTERRIFLECAPWVEETDRLCHARAREAGNPTSAPVLIKVRRAAVAESAK